MRPIVSAIFAAWIDFLVQQRLHELATFRARTLALLEEWDDTLSEAQREERINLAHWTILRDMNAPQEPGAQALGGGDNADEYVKPSLRMASMRMSRLTDSPRGVAIDLQDYAELFGIDREKTLGYATAIAGENVLMRAERARTLEDATRPLQQFDLSRMQPPADEALLAFTTSAIARIFPLLKQAGSPAETLHTLLVVDPDLSARTQEEKAELQKAVEALEARFNQTGSSQFVEFTPTLLKGAGLLQRLIVSNQRTTLTEEEQTQLVEQQRQREKQGQRLRVIERMAAVVRQTYALAATKRNQLQQVPARTQAMQNELDMLSAASDRLHTYYKGAQLLLEWMGNAQNLDKFVALERCIKARLRARQHRRNKRRTAAQQQRSLAGSGRGGRRAAPGAAPGAPLRASRRRV